MKKWIQNLTRKKIIMGITGAVSFIIFLIFLAISNHLSNKQDTQDMARRWSSDKDVAQVSCFFSQSVFMSENTIIGFEHGLDSALVEASITSKSENPNARLWADAYSATGSITIESKRAATTVDAVGIGGDFFLFHPLELVSGYYFSGNDLMQDYIIIDEEVAWLLFGSNDVSGQMVEIKGVPHIITGVVKRQTGRLAEAAGLDSSVAYVSYSSLKNYGVANEIGHFEIVMPNPVKNYALEYVKSKIGVPETEMEIVENGSRYNLLPLLKQIAAFGTRSMNGKAIIYPYWENIARGYEDILGLLLIAEILFLLYPTILVIIVVVMAWKHKTWTVKSVFAFLQDKWERRKILRINRKRGEKKYEKEFEEIMESNSGWNFGDWFVGLRGQRRGRKQQKRRKRKNK